MQIEYEPRFLEEAVLRAAGARPEGRLFYRERERLYAVRDPEERGRAFDALNLAWWERLGLGRPLADALGEEPLIAREVARRAVGRPPRRADAGAELLVRPGSRPGAADRLLRLLVPPEMALAPDAFTLLLRRELQHVADMLDPRFGYKPRLPAEAGGGAYERLLRDRYRAVWDATVDGRLLRAGRLPAAVEGERRAEFVRAFAGLDEHAAATAFARFFTDPTPTHDAIVAFVLAPGAGAVRPRTACALCGFPTRDFASGALTPAVLAAIAADFPGWQPSDGCCRQCADLYGGRPLSLASAEALPGIR
jgi:hypothetical protein